MQSSCIVVVGFFLDLRDRLFILTNYPDDEDLGLQDGQTREDAINEALDIINHFRELIQSLDNESR